jgi:CubicO group peptidase (beta-lactamase class C family)
MAGYTVPVRIEGNELSFQLPNAQGSFRGHAPSNGELHGHWFPPIALGMGQQHMSPVRLKTDGANRWSGEVVPFEDTFTFHLLLEKRADGTLGALLRNFDRDIGNQLGIERLERSGDAVKLIGKRGQQAVEVTGNWDSENQLLTFRFPNRGGSYDFRRDDDDSTFYPRGRHPARYSYRPPPARPDGWPTATLEQVNIDRPGIEKMIQELVEAPMEGRDTPRVHSVLIARHGKLVLEEYFHGENRDKLHETRSASKSVTAVLAGAAMYSGVPLKLSSPVYLVMNGGTFPPDLEPRKRAMTLEHLLTMSSGFFCDDTNDAAPGNEERMENESDEPDYYKFIMAVPMSTAPGESSVYCSAVANLALGMVTRAAHEYTLDLFDRLVAGPMQIETYGWGPDRAGNLYGGGGTKFLPRDFMKFGQLLLNGGTWQGHRILSREFAARAGSPLYHLRGQLYGYLWWGVDYPYKNRTVYAYFAGGAGGQSVVVVPDLDLVIASFGGNYFSPGTFFMQRNVIPRLLLPAVREAGDDRNAPVVPRDKDFEPKLGPRTESGPVQAK